MTQEQRLLMQTALAIGEQLHQTKTEAQAFELPTTTWQQCTTLHRKLQQAAQRGWQSAAGRLLQELRSNVERLRVELVNLEQQLRSSTTPSHKASAGELYEDLLALHDEFVEVFVDRRGRQLSVTTEAIILDDVYLGPFEIQLDWSSVSRGHSNCYRVIAVDPHPAAANEGVTHPHVQDELVCEGEARQSLRAALEQGRLLDFFLIVANLLHTYNSSSPFIALSDWHGVECGDCGSSVSDDERWTCEKCESTVCGECYYSCNACDGIYCHHCVQRCEGCDESHCAGCLSACLCCQAEVCPSCLQEERCTDCHEQALGREGSEGARQANPGQRSADAPLPA